MAISRRNGIHVSVVTTMQALAPPNYMHNVSQCALAGLAALLTSRFSPICHTYQGYLGICEVVWCVCGVKWLDKAYTSEVGRPGP